MNEIDPRLVRVGIEIDGQIKYYEDVAIVATGTKYGGENENEAEIKISNMTKETRDYLLTELSPFNKNRKTKKVYLDVGRVSYGYTRIYVGDVIATKVSQPPDISIDLKCATADSQKGNIVARSQPGTSGIKQIAAQAAKDMGLNLVYEAADKQVSNYSFSGGAAKQVGKIGQMGGVNAYIDDDKLVVKPAGDPLQNTMRILNIDTGMIGQPEITEKGIKVTYLIDAESKLGGGLEIQSKMNPAVTGVYTIYKLSFNITNRDVPFYFIAEASRPIYAGKGFAKKAKTVKSKTGKVAK